MTACVQPTYNLCVYQHASFKMPVQFTDSNGQSIDITNWTFSGSIKEKYKSTSTIAYFGVEEVNRTSGSVNFYLTPAQTALFVKNQYYYDIIAEVSGSNPPETLRVLEGTISVDFGVTDGALY